MFHYLACNPDKYLYYLALQPSKSWRLSLADCHFQSTQRSHRLELIHWNKTAKLFRWLKNTPIVRWAGGRMGWEEGEESMPMLGGQEEGSWKVEDESDSEEEVVLHPAVLPNSSAVSPCGDLAVMSAPCWSKNDVDAWLELTTACKSKESPDASTTLTSAPL